MVFILSFLGCFLRPPLFLPDLDLSLALELGACVGEDGIPILRRFCTLSFSSSSRTFLGLAFVGFGFFAALLVTPLVLT